MLYAILAFAFATTVLVVYGIYQLFFGNRNAIKNRLKIYTQDEAVFVETANYSFGAFLKSMGKPATIIEQIMPGKKYFESKRRKLAKAAVLMRPEEFIMICVGCGLLVGAILYLLVFSLAIVPFGFLLGYWIPNLILNHNVSSRGKRLNAQLPEALTIIANGLRAGYSFKQAITVVTKEMEEPISVEFSKVVRDNSLGKPMEEALLEMANKLEDEDMDMFITALIIQRQVGGNLSEIIETICNTIRERAKIRGEIRTLTANNRFSAIIISAMPIALAVVISFINPTYIRVLFTTGIGLILIFAAVVLDIIGILIMRKIVNIEV